MPIGHLIALLVPNFFGNSTTIGYWSTGSHEEITYYVGVIVVLLAAYGLRNKAESRRAGEAHAPVGVLFGHGAGRAAAAIGA